MLKILVYDGSFEGFLSCVFYSYEYGLENVSIESKHAVTDNFFDEIVEVTTNEEQSDRVWKGISKKSQIAKTLIYKAFLSEAYGVENDLLFFIQQIFEDKMNDAIDFSEPRILNVSKLAKMVGREKHRMDAFVRFRQTKDDVFFATIEPDFNTLPLNIAHFKNRYADQKWFIYDIKRNYGIFYDLEKVEIISLEMVEKSIIFDSPESVFTLSELEFQQLWSTYFESTNIKARINKKLHTRHVPKRYWKYLSEKSVGLKK